MKKLICLFAITLQFGCATPSPNASSQQSSGLALLYPIESIQAVNDFNFAMDKNGDGILSSAEFQSAALLVQHPLHGYQDEENFGELATQYMNALDADEDGELTLKEASGESLRTLYFNLQDENKDGFLSGDEFKAYEEKGVRGFNSFDVLPVVEGIGYDKVMLRDEGFDTDADDRVSLEEFLTRIPPYTGDLNTSSL